MVYRIPEKETRSTRAFSKPVEKLRAVSVNILQKKMESVPSLVDRLQLNFYDVWADFTSTFHSTSMSPPDYETIQRQATRINLLVQSWNSLLEIMRPK